MRAGVALQHAASRALQAVIKTCCRQATLRINFNQIRVEINVISDEWNVRTRPPRHFGEAKEEGSETTHREVVSDLIQPRALLDANRPKNKKSGLPIAWQPVAVG
jgi:hypothetical protein